MKPFISQTIRRRWFEQEAKLCFLGHFLTKSKVEITCIETITICWKVNMNIFSLCDQRVLSCPNKELAVNLDLEINNCPSTKQGNIKSCPTLRDKGKNVEGARGIRPSVSASAPTRSVSVHGKGKEAGLIDTNYIPNSVPWPKGRPRRRNENLSLFLPSSGESIK